MRGKSLWPAHWTQTRHVSNSEASILFLGSLRRSLDSGSKTATFCSWEIDWSYGIWMYRENTLFAGNNAAAIYTRRARLKDETGRSCHERHRGNKGRSGCKSRYSDPARRKSDKCPNCQCESSAGSCRDIDCDLRRGHAGMTWFHQQRSFWARHALGTFGLTT